MEAELQGFRSFKRLRLQCNGEISNPPRVFKPLEGYIKVADYFKIISEPGYSRESNKYQCLKRGSVRLSIRYAPSNSMSSSS